MQYHAFGFGPSFNNKLQTPLNVKQSTVNKQRIENKQQTGL